MSVNLYSSKNRYVCFNSVQKFSYKSMTPCRLHLKALKPAPRLCQKTLKVFYTIFFKGVPVFQNLLHISGKIIPRQPLVSTRRFVGFVLGKNRICEIWKNIELVYTNHCTNLQFLWSPRSDFKIRIRNFLGFFNRG